MVEYRRLADEAPVLNWRRTGAVFGWLALFLYAGALEISCLAQLAFQPSDPFVGPSAVMCGTGIMVGYLGVMVLLDILDPVADRRLKRDLLERMDKADADRQEFRAKVEALEAKLSEAPQLGLLMDVAWSC